MATFKINVKFDSATRIGTKAIDPILCSIEQCVELSDIHTAKVLEYIKELQQYEAAWRDKSGDEGAV